MGGRSGSSGMGSSGTGYADNANFKAFQKANFDAMKTLYKQGGMQAVQEAWYETRQEAERAGAHEITEELAVETIVDAIPRNVSEQIADDFRQRIPC